MADEHNQRPYRAADPYSRGAQQHAPAPAGNDPLAELARLIGQNDPFAEHGQRERPRANGRDRQMQAQQPEAAMDWHMPPESDPPPRKLRARDRRRLEELEHTFQQHERDHTPQRAPQAFDQQGYAQPHDRDPRYDAPGAYQQGYDEQAHIQHGRGQQYDDRYDGQGYHQQDQADQYYADDGQRGAAEEEFYDETPRPRRRWVIGIAAVASLFIVVTAGVLGYRSIFGATGTFPPPVIKALTSPSKVMASNDAQNSKPIQDRVGAGNEKVVSREEQPVNVKDGQPRVVFPNLVNSNNSSSRDSSPVVSQANASPNALASVEPKKVRTIVIKPDQPVMADAAATAGVAASMPPPSSARSAAPGRAGPPPMANPDPVPAPQPTPPRQVAATPQAAPPANPNAPLSLTPQDPVPPPPHGSMRTANAVPPRAAPTPAPSRATPASTGSAMAAAPAAPGAYVQISSQRSEGEAHASFNALKAKYPSVLGSRQVVIRRADLGDKGTYYRAMIGPFANSEEAVTLCTSLKSAGGSCIIQRN